MQQNPAPLLATVAPFGFGFDADHFLHTYHALGCTRAQVYRDPALTIPTPAIIDTIERAGMVIDSIHGRFGHDIDPSSPLAEERERCLALYESEARVTQDLGGSLVVVHPAANTPFNADFTPTRTYTPSEAHELQHQRWPHFHDFAARLAEIGERLNITFAIENLSWNVPLGHSPRALAEHIDAVASRHIRMCFDTGHAQVTTADVPAQLRECAPVIAYIHVHDAREGHAHLLPGDGEADWPGIARELRDSCSHIPRMLEFFHPPARIDHLIASTDLAATIAAACAIDTPAGSRS